MKTNTLRFKVLVWFSSFTAITILIISYLLYYFLEENINLKNQSSLYYVTKDIHDDIEEVGLENFLAKPDQFNNTNYLIIKDQTVIYKTARFQLQNPKQYINKDDVFFSYEMDTEDMIEAVYSLNFKEPFVGSILAYKSMIPNKAENLEKLLFILDPLLFFIIVFLAIKLVNKILDPIEKITQTADAITISNFSTTLDSSQKETEITHLVNTFNKMILRLQEGVKKLERFNSDVSHELRTPLTVIQTQIELALKKERSLHYYQNSLENIQKESQKLQQIVDNILLLSKYDTSNIQKSFYLCDINNLLLEVVEKYSLSADEKNITLEIQEFHKAKKELNCTLIKIVMSNLLDNAIKYSNNNTTIFLDLTMQKKNIVFNIKDQGIGIGSSHLNKLTERFYRIDDSRNKKIQGYGLGLSVVQNIINLHNGTLQIDSELGKGTSITVIF